MPPIFTLVGIALFLAGIASNVQARPTEFAEIVQSAKSDPDYRELDFRSNQLVYTSGFSHRSQVHTILRDSVTYYQEIETGAFPLILTRSNKCYVSEINQAAYQDQKAHLTYHSRDTANYLLLPFAKLIDSIPAAKPVSVSDSLWVVEGASDSVSYRLEYNPNSRKVLRIRRDTRADSTLMTVAYAVYWDSLWKDSIQYPLVTNMRTALFNSSLKQWISASIIDSTLDLVRPNGIPNEIFLANDQSGQSIDCNDGTSIRIQSPAQDVVWPSGTSHIIRWESIGIPGDVFIEYFNRSGYYDPVVMRPDSLSKEFSWTVPESVADRSTLRISSMRSFAKDQVSFQTRATTGVFFVGKGRRGPAMGAGKNCTPTFTEGPGSRAAIDAIGRWIPVAQGAYGP